MKKLLLSIALIISASAMSAEENITTIVGARAGGFADVMTGMVEQSLGATHNKRITLNNCASVIDYMNKTDEPAIAVGWPDMQVGKDNACAIKEDMFQGYIAASPMYLCVTEQNKQGAIKRLLADKDIKIGYANWPWIDDQIHKLLPSVNSTAKAIPYSNSNGSRAALASGEVDFILSSLGKDGEYCPIVLGEKLTEDAIIRGVDLFPESPQSLFYYSAYLIGINLPEDNNILNNLYASSVWQNRVYDRYQQFMYLQPLTQQFKHLNQ